MLLQRKQNYRTVATPVPGVTQIPISERICKSPSSIRDGARTNPSNRTVSLHASLKHEQQGYSQLYRD
jgi:hypothetical protein